MNSIREQYAHVEAALQKLVTIGLLAAEDVERTRRMIMARRSFDEVPTPARLIVPLDTHVIRLGQCLRLTRYRSPGWRMAADITARLRALDPSDPVRFDFSLCHVGMMGNCGFATKQRDSQCPLRGLCSPRRRG